jgi:hypothetical protein
VVKPLCLPARRSAAARCSRFHMRHMAPTQAPHREAYPTPKTCSQIPCEYKEDIKLFEAVELNLVCLRSGSRDCFSPRICGVQVKFAGKQFVLSRHVISCKSKLPFFCF